MNNLHRLRKLRAQLDEIIEDEEAMPAQPVRESLRVSLYVDGSVLSFGEENLKKATFGRNSVKYYKDGGLLFLLFESKNKKTAVFTNPFPGMPKPIALSRISMVVDGRYSAIADRTLLPGAVLFLEPESHKKYKWIPQRNTVGTYEPAPVELQDKVSKYEFKLSNMPTDTNQGGGFLIYPNQLWMNCEEGANLAAQFAQFYAEVTPIFWVDAYALLTHGELTPADIKATQVDGSRSYAVRDKYPYMGSGEYVPQPSVTIDKQYRPLDHDHYGRLSHVSYSLAQSGYEWADMVVMMMTEDVYSKYCVYNSADGNVGQYWWWSTMGYSKHCDHWRGRGAPFLGRDFGQCLTVLAYGISRGWLETTDVNPMLELVRMFYDKSNHALYVIHRETHTGGVSNKWKHKVQTWPQHNIPEDVVDSDMKIPSIQVGFEELVTLTGLMMLEQAGVEDCSELISEMTKAAHSFNRHLRVIDKFRWSTADGSYWKEHFLGLTPKDELQDMVRYSSSWLAAPYSIVTESIMR